MVIYLKYYFILMNILGFLFMYIDKEKAKNGKLRIKESILIIAAVIGGSLGSYAGMQIFRYKSEHGEFKYGILLIILIHLVIFIYLGNNIISISRFSIESRNIPTEFNGYKIVQISDLHNKVFFENNNRLVNIIKNEKPDAIFFTGDIADRRNYSEDNIMLLMEKIKTYAPVYFVTGNNEILSGKFSSLEKKLKACGVIVLRNISVLVKRGSSEIYISGIDDPVINKSEYEENYKDTSFAKEEIEKIKKDGSYNILLSHRPELFKLYADEKIDLIFTGHAHGGQVILPFLGGVIAPNQGFFPEYYKGVYRNEDTSMVVSRGLGNSLAPVRLFNLPEIVIVNLKGQS
ncbi:MAG: DUF1294 domain-containing protein [Bacillota bacterium]|nr:DUF1294 domain-containing protein [Bacillota bacterium]